MSGPLQKSKPLPGDLMSVSQGDLKNNSEYWVDSLSKDHQIVNGDTSATTFEGRHIQVSLNDRTTANVAMPADGENGIVFHNASKLYWRSSNASMTAGIPLTINASWAQPNAFARFGANTAYGGPGPGETDGTWSFLPGELIIQAGFSTIKKALNTGVGIVAQTTDINFPIPFQSFKLAVTLTPIRSSANVDAVYLNGFNEANLTTFTVCNTSTSIDEITWIAIGK